MSHGRGSRTFIIPTSATKSVEIQIREPALRAEGLSLATWTSSFVLASLLHRLQIDIPNREDDHESITVLELGAGTGLVGITASMAWATSVVLTDLPPIVPGLAGNIALNAPLVSEHGGVIRCGTLDWNSPSALVLDGAGLSFSSARSKAAVILAADTVYSEEHPALISSVICAWLAPGTESRAILTYPMRVAYLDQIRELWELLQQNGLVSVEEGRQTESEEAWDDECLCEWSVWKWKE